MIKSYKIFITNSEKKMFQCNLTLDIGNTCTLNVSSSYLGEHSWVGIDILDSFNQLRVFVESKGFIILVNGTRKNTWASGGLRDSSNGELTYLLDDNLNHTLLNIFDYSDKNNVTLEEHIEYYKNWWP